MTALIQLETPRLLLRHWRLHDRGPFADLNADPEVMRHFPAPLDRAASDTLAEQITSRLAHQGWGFWALEHKSDGRFIGFTGLNRPGNLPIPPCVEIGWRIARQYWGQGLVTEAARACLDFAFAQLELESVVAFTALGNRRSRAVMQRLGMQKESEFDHPGVPEGSHLRRHCLYRVTRQQWSIRQ